MDAETARDEMKALATDLDLSSYDKIISAVQRRQQIFEECESHYEGLESFPDPSTYTELNEVDTGVARQIRAKITQNGLGQAGPADWGLYETFINMEDSPNTDKIGEFTLTFLNSNIVRLFRDGMMSEVRQEHVDTGFELSNHSRTVSGIGALGLCMDTPHLDFKSPFMRFVNERSFNTTVHYSHNESEKRSTVRSGVAEILVVASLANQDRAVQYLREIYTRFDRIDREEIDQLSVLRAQHRINNDEFEFLDERDPVYLWLQNE